MSHVVIELEVEQKKTGSKNITTANVVIENSGKVPKQIDYAVLLITPDNTQLRNIVLPPNNGENKTDGVSDPLNSLYNKRYTSIEFDSESEVCVIPLKFIYDEQGQIGNEKIQYRHVIPSNVGREGQVYLVRAIIYVKYSLGIVRWRTTSDLYFP